MNSPLKGFSFPFRIDSRTGGVAVTEGGDKLQENLKHLLLTRVGERVMLRQYGGGVTDLQHEPINNALLGLARHQISKTILQFEPRVFPQDVTVIPRDGELYLRVEYVHAESQQIPETLDIPLNQK